MSVVLGQSRIARLREINSEVYDIVSNDFPDQYNTFQYVVKNLDEWADEVTVANDTRQRLQATVDKCYKLMEGSKKLYQVVEDLANQQESLNNGTFS